MATLTARPPRGVMRYSGWAPPTGNGWHVQHWCRGVRRNVSVVRSGDHAQLTCLVCGDVFRMERRSTTVSLS